MAFILNPYFLCLRLLFIIMLLFLTLTNASDKNNKSYQTSNIFTISNFLTTLLSKRFENCSMVLIQTVFPSENPVLPHIKKINELEGVVDSVLRQSSHDSFLIQLKGETNSLIGVGNISSKLENLWDVHMKRDRCTVAVLIISDYVTKLGDNLYEHISKWTNILKKDQDYHIFVTGEVIKERNYAETRSSNEILLTSQIAQGIKFKVLIQQDDFSEENFKLTSTCFYCNYGKPKSVSVLWGSIHSKYTTPKSNSPDESIQFTALGNLFPDFSKNFHGKIMKVGTPTGTRWLNEIRLENGMWIAKRGLYKIVMDNLMERYNFTCDFFPSAGGGGTGAQFKNGTWTGSVADVYYKNSDLGHVTGQTWSRSKVVGFSYPVSYETLTFTSGEPLAFFSWKAIFWPLSRELWIGLGLSFIIVTATFYFLIRCSKEPFEYTNILTYTYGSLLEQDLPSLERLRANPVRVFICFWLLYTVVIATAYRSKLVSFLAFPNVVEPPRTFEELANSNYEFSLQYLRGAAFALLKTSPNPVYQKIFKRMQLELDEVKCFEKAIGKRFVCISWAKIAEFVYRRNLTDPYGRVPLTMAPDSTCFLSVGIIMEKRAIFMTNFNSLIIHATDTGLLIKWSNMDLDFVHKERRLWEKETNRTLNNYFVDSSDALTNQHLRGSYYLLALGSLLGLCAFVGEKIIFSRKNTVIITLPTTQYTD